MPQRTNAVIDQNRHATLLGVSTADGVTPVAVEVDPTTGALLTSTSLGGQLVTEAFDYIAAAYPDNTTEVYTYKSGGSSGTTVSTVTVVYEDATKAAITSVSRT